jgi:hypothetical protein
MLKAIAIAASFTTVAMAAGEEVLPRLAERLTGPAYRQPLERILAGAKLPAWIDTFMRTRKAFDTPGSPKAIDGEAFELYAVCDLHHCGGNFLYVLYPAHGGKAWAMVTKEGAVAGYLGDPSLGQRTVLLDAARH